MTAPQTTQTDDGVQIAYEVEGAGDPLVLIHGITENRRAWDHLVPHLRDEFQIIRLDLRGHGESASAEDYSLGALAGDVAAVVTAVGADQPHVVGHSLGGTTATWYGAFHPARTVINVDQPLQLGEFQSMVREMAPALRGDGFLDALNAEMEALGGPALSDAHKAQLREFRSGAQQAVVLALWEPLLELTPEELTQMVESLLPEVRVPYLALHGTDLGQPYADWLTGLMPTTTVEYWDGLGHWLHLIEPDRFMDRLRAFIAAA